MSLDLSLYLVTDQRLCGERGVAATVAGAVRGGVRAVQLRDKNASAAALLRSAAEVRAVLHGTGVPLVINDRLDVAMAAGADGVHLGQSDLDATRARELAGPAFLIGLSVSSPADIDAANALPPGTVDYLGIGPVFVTATKTDARDPLGVDRLAKLRRRTHLPCVGIGGIGPRNAVSVWNTGVDGIAVVSAICAAESPEGAAEELGRLRP